METACQFAGTFHAFLKMYVMVERRSIFAINIGNEDYGCFCVGLRHSKYVIYGIDFGLGWFPAVFGQFFDYTVR